MNADDLYKVIIAINIAIQKLLSFAVSKHAVEHPDARSIVANEAFSEVLSNHLPVIKEKVRLIKTKANSRKIFQANSTNLLPSIDISRLDSCFLLDILLKVEEFFDFTPIVGNCTHIQCQKECCSICNHASAVCRNCISNSGKPSKKCHHLCSNCKKSEKECANYSQICCQSCLRCKNCNKDALTIRENNVINNISVTVYPCVLTEYQRSLEILLCFRNLFGHCLKLDCEDFLNGKPIGDFENIFKYEQLIRYITYAFEVVLCYTTDPKNFTKFPNPTYKVYKVETLEDIKSIFHCQKSLQSHLNDIKKFQEIFQVGADIIKEIENLEFKLQETFKKSYDLNCKNHDSICKNTSMLETLLERVPKSDNANLDEKKKSRELQLEKNCGSFCIFCVDCQISKDNIQSFMYTKVDKEDQEFKQWEDLHYKDLIVKENFSYIVSDSCLESGYLYSFKLELKDDEVFEYNKLAAIDESECGNTNMINSMIVLIAYNNGKKSNVHMQKLEEEIKEEMEIKNKILGGANVPATNVKGFKKICQEYYQHSSYLKRFPPGYLQQHTSRIGDMFQQLFERSEDFFNIISGPQFVKQLKLFGFTAKDLETSQIEDAETTERDILVANFSLNFSQMLIMSICVSESENVHEVKDDVNRCNGNVKALRILHEESLTNTFAAVCAILACPRITRQSFEKENHVYNAEDVSLFLTADDLQDVDCLERWWEEAIQDAVSEEKKDYGIEVSEESTQRCRSAYQSIVGETMATMSIIDVTLPRLSSDPNTQVTSLLLNIEQQDAINKGSCIVNGPFGSGKSLVLKEIARRLSRSDENSSIYFVCLDPYSLLEVDAVKYLDSLEKRKDKSSKVKLYHMRHLVEKGNEALIDLNNLPNIIDRICNIEQQPTSFLFDEMNGDTFTKDHANKLKDFVDNKNNLRELVLAPQSIQKDREVHHNGQRTSLTKNQFQETGLENVELPKRMRMTAKINDVIQVAEECVKRIETTFKIPESPKKNVTNDEAWEGIAKSDINISTTKKVNHSTIPFRLDLDQNLKDKETSENLDDEIKIQSDVSVITEKIAQLEIPDEVDNSEHAIPEEVKELSGEVSGHSDNMSDHAEHNDSIEQNKEHNNKKKKKRKKAQHKDVSFDAEGYLDTDDIFAKLQSNLPRDSSFRSVRNIYRYQSGDIGHTVKGRKPQLIFLDPNFDIDSAKSGNILSCVLKMTCLKDRKHTTIVCSYKSEAILMCYALKRLKKKYHPYFHHLLEEPPPSYEDKEKLWGELLKPNVILVTDYRGFRGCETEYCITFVNQESVYKSHILVEVLARAVAHIDILVLPIQANSNADQKGRVNTNEATLADVIDEWKRPKDDGEYIVEVSDVSTKEKAGKLEVKVNEVVKLVEVTLSDEDEFRGVKATYKSGNVLSVKQCDQFLENIPHNTVVDSMDQSSSSMHQFATTAWENLDFLHQSVYGMVIGKHGKNLRKLEREFRVGLRFNQQAKKMQISGPIRYKELAAKSLHSRFVSDSLHERWDVIIDSSWKNYTKILDIVTEKFRIFQREFGISINIDKYNKQILIKGARDNKVRFLISIYKKMLKPVRLGARSILCIGLSEESKVVLRRFLQYSQLCYISTQEYSTGKNAHKVNELVVGALRIAKDKISRLSTSMCCMMLHVGRMFSKLSDGTYTMRDAFFNAQKQMVYKRLAHGDLNINTITDLRHIRTVYRYDMSILTPEPALRCRCKLYLRRDGNGAAFITCKEAGDRKPPFSNIPAWPVYFDIPGQKISRLDIVDPRNGLTTRVAVSLFEVDKEFESQLQVHLSVLKKKVFNDIKVKEGTIDLDIPEMPNGYVLCFLRRSERKSYRAPSTRMIMTTSAEEVLLDYEGTDDSKVMDIFIDDEDILDALDHTDWRPERVAEGYQRVIRFGNEYLQKLLTAR